MPLRAMQQTFIFVGNSKLAAASCKGVFPLLSIELTFTFLLNRI